MKVTADDVAQLLAVRPPREVPAHVARAARRETGGWLLPAVGLFFGAFGMIFVFVFFPWRFVDECRLDLSDATAAGIVVGQSDTSMSVDDEKVVAYAFVFTAADGHRYDGECYAPGGRWKRGEAVAVQYVSGRPAVARIEGGRLNQAGRAGAFVALFPLVGFGLVVASIRGRRRLSWLLRQGRAVEVDVLAVDATKVTMNYQTVYRITISAPVPAAGTSLTFRRWGKAEVSLLTGRALNKQPIYVLCDPDEPKHLIFPETLIEP